MAIDPEVAWYYEQGSEPARLKAESQLEEARTRHIIAKRLPNGRLSVVDIGGGAGAYSVWLAGRGHSVHLVEPIRLHVDAAEAAQAEAGVRLAGIHEASAGDLPFDDGQFDVALLLGPLYHLTEHEDRIAAVKETRRVLRPAGVLFSATINRYAGAVDGFFRNLIARADFVEMMRQEIATGQHRNPTRRRGLFTKAYFHLPEQLRTELLESGFTDVALVAVESIFSCVPDFDRKWEDPEFRQLLMATIEEMETEPSVIGMGGHLMGIARRTERPDRQGA